MPYTAVATRSVMQLPQLKNHLKIDPTFTDFDVELKLFLRAAKEDADKTLVNPFLASDGITPAPIPALVEVWVLMRAANLYEWRILQQRSENIAGVGSSSVDPAPDYSNIIHLRDPRGRVGF
jgi:hypothetical protein